MLYRCRYGVALSLVWLIHLVVLSYTAARLVKAAAQWLRISRGFKVIAEHFHWLVPGSDSGTFNM